MKHLIRLTLMLLIAVAATACVNSDTVDGPVCMTRWDIATFTGFSTEGATFAVCQGGDAPVATLTAQGVASLNEEITEGRRVLITYVPATDVPYTSSNISLLSAVPINQAEVEAAEATDLTSWNADPIYLLTIWRTGTFINIYCQLPYYTEPRVFSLAADASTVGTERPQLYLCHVLPEPVNSFRRAYYASFDASAIWNLPTTQTLDIHINDSNLNKEVYSFSKLK